MNIELKNIKVSEHLSEETNAFTSDIYVNGIRAGVASNHGTGGPTNYYPVNEDGKTLIRQAEDYCKKLPPEHFSFGGEQYTVDMDLEHHIDKLLGDYLREKDLKHFRNKVDKATRQGIVYGVPDQSFTVLPLRNPISLILLHHKGAAALSDVIKKSVAPELKDNIIILNTNLPEKVLTGAGLKEGQYVLPQPQETLKKSQRKGRSRNI